MKVAIAAFLFAKRNVEVKQLIDDLQCIIYDLYKKIVILKYTNGI
jgi:hypothetical protein